MLLRKSFVANHDAIWNTHQFCIGKLFAVTDIRAVIKDKTFRIYSVKLFSFSDTLLADTNQVIFIWRNLFWPAKTLVITGLFGNYAHRTGRTNTIATHKDRLTLAIFVVKFEAKRVGILCTEGKDIANLGSFLLVELFRINIEHLEGIFVIDFFVDGDILLVVDIDNIFTSITERLELVAKLAETTTACKGAICTVANT